jgi:hypothetical protein
LLYLGHVERVRSSEIHLHAQIPCSLFCAILHYRGVRVTRDHVGRHLDENVRAAGEPFSTTGLAALLLLATASSSSEQCGTGDAYAACPQEVFAADSPFGHKSFSVFFPTHCLTPFNPKAQLQFRLIYTI